VEDFLTRPQFVKDKLWISSYTWKFPSEWRSMLRENYKICGALMTIHLETILFLFSSF